MSSGRPIISVALRWADATDEDMQLLAKLPQLREVDVSGTDITGQGLEWLANTPHLETLRAYDLDLDDGDLHRLAKAVNLVSLGVMGNDKISGVGFRGLLFPKLRELYLGDILGGKGLRFLADTCTGLERLQLDYAKISVEGARHIGKIKTLQTLSLRGSSVGDLHMAELAGLTNLRTLVLSETAVTDRGLKYLASATKLQELWVGRTGVSGEAATCFSKLSTLCLEGEYVDDQSIGYVLQCPNLELLVLDQSKITTAGVERLGRHKRLSRLMLNYFELTDKGVASLWSLPSLQRIRFFYCGMPSNGFRGIERSTTLRHLEIIKCKLTPDDMLAIAKIPTLDKLLISSCDLNDDFTPILKRLYGMDLKEIDVDPKGLSDTRIDELRRALPNWGY